MPISPDDPCTRTERRPLTADPPAPDTRPAVDPRPATRASISGTPRTTAPFERPSLRRHRRGRPHLSNDPASDVTAEDDRTFRTIQPPTSPPSNDPATLRTTQPPFERPSHPSNDPATFRTTQPPFERPSHLSNDPATFRTTQPPTSPPRTTAPFEHPASDVTAEDDRTLRTPSLRRHRRGRPHPSSERSNTPTMQVCNVSEPSDTHLQVPLCGTCENPKFLVAFGAKSNQ